MKRYFSSYFEEPEFKETLASYEGMLKNHTPIYFDAEDLTDIADYYIYIGKEKEADKAMEYSLQLHPENIDALVYKVRRHYFNGQREKAYQLLKQIEDPTDREVMFLKAELLIEEQKYREAEEVYMELAEAEGESIHVLCDIALCYMDSNNEEYTRLWIKRIADKGYTIENNQVYRDLWCNFCLTFGNPADAVQAYQISVDEEPYSVINWTNLARCYMAQSDFPKAHEALDFALAIDSDNQEAKETRGYCYYVQESYEAAINAFETVLPTSLKRNNIYQTLALCYVNMEMMEKAIDCYQTWMKEYPDMDNIEKSEIHNSIASCHFHLKNYQKCMEHCDLSIESDPYFFDPLFLKAATYMCMDDDQSAEQTFQHALEICPEEDKENAYYNIANNYMYAKRYEKCIEWCNNAQKIFPESRKKAVVLMTYCYIEMEDYLEGLTYLLEAIDLYKDELINDPEGEGAIQQLLKTFKDKNNGIDLTDLI